MNERAQVFLDTETTGMQVETGHRVIEIGGTVVIDGMHTGEEFHTLLNPQREVDEAAQQVHGFSLNDLEDQPLFEDIVEEFVQFIRGKQVFCHNASFDIRFLDSEFARIERDERMTQICTVVDTMAIAKEIHKSGQISLDALCSKYGVDRTSRDKHGALLDAQLLSEVYLRMQESRNSLLGEIEAEETQLIEPVLLSRPNRKPKIVYATSQELEAHQTYMEKLAKQS